MRRRDILKGAGGAVVCASPLKVLGRSRLPKETEIQTVEGTPRLQLRRRRGSGRAVLYVHGATFPSALSVGYLFADGVSWEDALASEGFDVWALDFEGFGGSERPAAFSHAPGSAPPTLRAPDAASQIARAAEHILHARSDADPIGVIAHSWGTIPAAIFASDNPGQVSELVMFGPILARPAPKGAPIPAFDRLPAWRLMTLAEQLARFTEDAPTGQAPVLEEPHLARWGPAWLATDPEAATRTPPAVKIPGGPIADIVATWSGRALYDPGRLPLRTLVVRGAWDSLCTDADAARFASAFGGRRMSDVVAPRATHLMHLEEGRFALYAAANAFLKGQSAEEAAARIRPK